MTHYDKHNPHTSTLDWYEDSITLDNYSGSITNVMLLIMRLMYGVTFNIYEYSIINVMLWIMRLRYGVTIIKS